MSLDRRLVSVLVAFAVAAAGLALAPAAAAGQTFYVDKRDPDCSSLGTSASPFCSINAAADRAGAGDSVLVRTGTYFEHVEFPNSGSSGARIVFEPAPGADVLVRGGASAFEFPNVDWITVRGFRVTDTSNHAIYISDSSNITVDGLDVSGAGEPIDGGTARGIYVSDTVDSLIVNNVVHNNSDSGIHLKGSTTRVEIRRNKVFENARQYVRAAPGIDLRAGGNTVVGNTSHHNEDSGIQVYTGARNNLLVNNLSYDNGDHGIDVLRASGQRIIGNTVYRNDTAGINLEGGSTSGSTGGTLANNISVDNALNSTRTRGNIRVDVNSISGTTIDFDLVWLSAPGTQIVWGDNKYSSLAAFKAAVPQEARGIEANPLFAEPAGGDFHLKAGSPAIDSANSGASGQRTTDLEGKPRIDDPGTPNTGGGTRPYDDRGAFEFKPPSAPIAVDDQATTVEDVGQSIAVLANDSDPDGGALRVTGVTDPPNGTTSVAADGTIDYVPDENFNGSDAFTYTISNSSDLTASARVTVSVAAVNDPPVARADEATTREGTPVVIDALANDSDVEGDTLTIGGVTTPAHGTATAVPTGPIVYTPIGDYIGPDSFEYTIVDGRGGSATAQVSITVTASAPPVAADDAADTDEDVATAIDVLANDSDPDGDRVTVQQVTEPSHGSAVINEAGTITYTPAPDYNGPDSFSYTASDPGGATDDATVTVQVAPTNDAPVARDDTETVPMNDASTFGVLGNDTDIDGDTLVVDAVTSPSHGSTAISPDGRITYTPTAGYEGPDAFTYTVSDGAGGTATGRVDLDVDAVPVARIAVSPASGSAPLQVTADASGSTDTSRNPIASYRFSFGDGTVVGPQASATASHTFTSSADFPVRVTVTDTAGLSSTATTLVRVSKELVDNGGFETSTTGWAGSPTGVTVTRSLTLPHSGLHSGKVSNDLTTTTSCTLNDSPNWALQSEAGTYRASMWVRGGVVGSQLKLRLREYAGTVLVGTEVAALNLTDGWQLLSVTYTPSSPGASTIDLNAFVNDAPPGTCFYVDDVSLTHVGLTDASNAAPDAVDDVAAVDEDAPSSTVNVLGNDRDADGDPLTVTRVTEPAHGTAAISPAGAVTYSPGPNYNGPDEFTYTVKDPGGSTDSARVVVDVRPVNDAPTAVDDAKSTEMNTATTFGVAGNDIDIDGDPLTVVSVTTADHGSTTLNADGTITYTPARDFQGSDSFGYTVSDGMGGSDTATVNMTVTGAVELVGNGGFESSLAGWVGAPAGAVVLSRGPFSPHSGAYAAALNNSVAGTSCTLNDSPNWVGTTQAGTYTASLWVRAPSDGAQIKVRLREYVGSTAVGSQVNSYALTTAWQRVTVAYTVRSPGSSTLDLNAYVSNAPVGDCFYVDDISMTRS